MDRTTGQRTLNLSAAQASTLLTQSLLRRALDSGARPKALIVNAKPAVLLGGPEVNARAWQEVFSLRDGFELLRITGNAPFVASTLVGRLFPSLRSRLEIRSAITAALSGETDKIRAINPVLWRNWSVNGGAQRCFRRGPFSAVRSPPEVRQQLYTDLFYVDPANAQAIEGILEIAAERRIPIFWVLFPLSPKLQSLRDQSGADERHDEFLRSIVARHSGQLTVLDARRSGYPAAFFADATHLNRRGALALSRSVAAAVVGAGEARTTGACVAACLDRNGRPNRERCRMGRWDRRRRRVQTHRQVRTCNPCVVPLRQRGRTPCVSAVSSCFWARNQPLLNVS